MKVNNCENQNVGAINAIEDAVRKFTQNCPPYVAVYNLVLNGIARNPIQNGIDLG